KALAFHLERLFGCKTVDLNTVRHPDWILMKGWPSVFPGLSSKQGPVGLDPFLDRPALILPLENDLKQLLPAAGSEPGLRNLLLQDPRRVVKGGRIDNKLHDIFNDIRN